MNNQKQQNMNRLYAIALAATLAAPATLRAEYVVGAKAEIPVGYYDCLKGKTGLELKNALQTVARPVSMPSYGSGNNSTWYYFWDTDRMPDGTTWRNRYSDDVFQVGTRGNSCTGMNIEHSFPRSWFGGSGSAPDNDLFNLYPSPATTNGSKSNYIMDQVAVVNTAKSDGYTKIGTSTHTTESTVWEPNDDFKGDFSRGYMYMITAWQEDVTYTSRAMSFMDNGKYPALFDWAAQLYSAWCRLDQVDEIEINRNNTIYTIQSCRNPYIDFPNLFEYLWGDSTARAFDPGNTLVAGGGTYTAGTGGDEDIDVTDPANYSKMEVIYSAAYTAGVAGATEQTTTAPGTYSTVWTRSSSYGWTANGYISGARYECDGTLYTEAIDLSAVTNAYAKFSHAVNYLTTGMQDYLTVYVVCDGTAVAINDQVTWPAGSNNTFVDSGVINLSAYAGKSVQLAFRYVSGGTSTTCGRWNVKSVEVRGGSTSGIEEVAAPAGRGYDPALPADFFRADGRRAAPDASGLLIVRQNGHTYKIVK